MSMKEPAIVKIEEWEEKFDEIFNSMWFRHIHKNGGEKEMWKESFTRRIAISNEKQMYKMKAYIREWLEEANKQFINPIIRRMSMKPSERINEIAYGSTGGYKPTVEVSIWAIMNYLDEQYEVEELARQKLLKDLKPMD